jgi:hypothetical protein
MEELKKKLVTGSLVQETNLPKAISEAIAKKALYRVPCEDGCKYKRGNGLYKYGVKVCCGANAPKDPSE